jgi:heterodisulfide reductase subunit D
MEFKVTTMAELMAMGEEPEILFWVGCAGSYDERAQKITRDICKILHHVGIKYAVLGTEESCTGDPAKSEYPGLGGSYEVIHHSQLIQDLINEGKLTAEGGESFKGKKITFHDPCYLGRGNDVYEAPRKALEILDADLVEMKRCKKNGLCCGAGGAQMFKEPEPGFKDINIERIEEALTIEPQIIAAGCPFCMTMLSDGVKLKDKDQEVKVLDIAEITVRANGL